jgi:hypothetical protein
MFGGPAHLVHIPNQLHSQNNLANLLIYSLVKIQDMR